VLVVPQCSRTGDTGSPLTDDRALAS
jgi:hypothetical protein